jgi:hypothetical protein
MPARGGDDVAVATMHRARHPVATTDLVDHRAADADRCVRLEGRALVGLEIARGFDQAEHAGLDEVVDLHARRQARREVVRDAAHELGVAFDDLRRIATMLRAVLGGRRGVHAAGAARRRGDQAFEEEFDVSARALRRLPLRRAPGDVAERERRRTRREGFDHRFLALHGAAQPFVARDRAEVGQRHVEEASGDAFELCEQLAALAGMRDLVGEHLHAVDAALAAEHLDQRVRIGDRSRFVADHDDHVLAAWQKVSTPSAMPAALSTTIVSICNSSCENACTSPTCCCGSKFGHVALAGRGGHDVQPARPFDHGVAPVRSGRR